MNGSAATAGVPDIRITPGDLDALRTLLQKLEGKRSVRSVAFLRSEIERAAVVEGTAPPDFAGLGSRVLFRDDEGRLRRHTLVLPGTAERYPDGLSVVTVTGAALLGLRPWQRMTYGMPDGRMRSIRILEVASGTGSGASRPC